LKIGGTLKSLNDVGVVVAGYLSLNDFGFINYTAVVFAGYFFLGGGLTLNTHFSGG